MNHNAQFEHRASSSRGKHDGESSSLLCDRPSRTRDTRQRQLSTDHDCAVSTREYQTDQSSLKSAPTAARPVLGKRPMQRQRQKQPHRCAAIDRVTPYRESAGDRLGRPRRSRVVSASVLECGLRVSAFAATDRANPCFFRRHCTIGPLTITGAVFCGRGLRSVWKRPTRFYGEKDGRGMSAYAPATMARVLLYG